ncbi:hypothetical protein [Streptomyces sp. URMC 129]|uniref:hypothetical protein n=1 Tax=Streptomyces sp. URMC 129 TaxID=3423407 RepID=UPI003F1B3CC2
MPERTSANRSHRVVRGAVAALLLTGLGAGGYAAVRLWQDTQEPPHCWVAREDGERAFTLEPQQAANAATIEAVASSRGLPERAVTIALATAMQESALRNLDYGDRDSLGLFQQRPSMGWGTEEQVMDPVYAAGAFYDRLVEVPDYMTMPLTEAAQEVQRSAYPDEYAKHEDEAELLSGALTGRTAEALTCVWDPEDPEEAPGVPAGPAEVLERMVREFGEDVRPVGDGAAVTVPVAEEGVPERGWELAHWAVAHSAGLGIERIVYGDRIWEASRSSDGWREFSGDDGNGDDGENSGGSGAASTTELRMSVLVPEQ